MPSKISGKPNYESNGLRIYFKSHPAKRNGKDRLWVHIRQEKPKKWRIAATLSYVNSIDVRFEK